MAEDIDLDIQRKIFELIEKNPGITRIQLSEILDLGLPIIAQYIGSLLEEGSILALGGADENKYYVRKRQVDRSDRRSDETRMNILDLISKNPGMHLSKIARALHMSSPLAEYHLTQMEKNSLLVSVRDQSGYYKRYYRKDSDVGTREKQILGLLRKKPQLKIVLLLIQHNQMKHKEIWQHFKVTQPTLSYHLRLLVESEILETISYGNEKGYRLKNRKEIISLVRKYTLHTIVEDFINMWDDINLIE